MAASLDLIYAMSSAPAQAHSSHDTWEQLLIEASREVFEMMVQLPLAPAAQATTEPGEFAAVVGLAGPITGIFSVRCNQQTASAIASGMLGVDLVEAKGEVWDALGEVCNMVAGNFKAKIGPAGEASQLTVPTVIHGHDYRLRTLLNGNRLECLMQSSQGMLHFRLDYRLNQ